MRDRCAAKKILLVHDRFGAFAGAETNLFSTASELKQRGHEVALLHGPDTNQGLDSWRELFTQRFSLNPATAASDVITAIRQFAPDVLYVHNLSHIEALETLLAANIPAVRMIHDHQLYCLRSYKYNYFTREICQRALSPYCLVPCGAFLTRAHTGPLPVKWTSYSQKRRELELNRRFDSVLVATRFMRDQLLLNGFSADQIEIHPPVPRAAAVTQTSSFSDRNLIVYSGQITRGKGVDVLLQALACLTTHFECLIFGDGNYRAHCKRLAHSLGLSSCVQFEGYVAPEIIALHYRDASIAAMSSVWPEPFGAAGLEGMRYGLPVVAFDSGGIKEWLTDGVNGFLVPWMNHLRYAECLERLLTDKNLARRMGERARQTITENFSFARYIDGLENLFARLTARSAPVVLT